MENTGETRREQIEALVQHVQALLNDPIHMERLRARDRQKRQELQQALRDNHLNIAHHKAERARRKERADLPVGPKRQR